MRVIYFLLVVVTIALGLFSRSNLVASPSFVNRYIGDALWALMVFWGVRMILPNQAVWLSALFALIFAFGIEFSQLYHAPWIDSIRATRLGGLVLGFGFLFSDLLSYTVGILCGVLLNTYFLKTKFS